MYCFCVGYQIAWPTRVPVSVLFISLLLINFVGLPYIRCNDSTDDTVSNALCVNDNASCSYQIAPDSPDDTCSMIYFPPTAEECQSSEFEGDTDPYNILGKVKLSPYIHVVQKAYRMVAFNVTFFNMSWTNLRMRFFKEPSQPNEIRPQSCREFRITEDHKNSTLFYDCVWNDYTYEDSTYHFQYIAVSSDGSPYLYKYVFVVPRHARREEWTPLGDWQLFLVVDVSVLPVLRLQIQCAPAHYNISSYSVKLWRSSKPEGNAWVVNSYDVKAPLNATEDTFLQVSYDSAYKPGVYTFTAIPVHPVCAETNKCALSETPPILIVASPKMPLLMGIVFTVIMIPIALAGYFIWRRSCVQKTSGDEPRLPPKVLLVYNPNYSSHVDDMIAFTNFLKNTCHLDPMFDLFHIPNSESKDPTKWYLVAFQEADFILVFASPPGPVASEPHRLNTYLHLDKIALSQLRLRLVQVPGPQCDAVSVLLPGCSWSTLPEEAVSLRRFTLPRDQDPLLVFLGAAPICDNGVALLEALRKAKPQPITEQSLPPPIIDDSPFPLYHPYLEKPPPVSEPRTPLDNEGKEINLMGDQSKEELKPLCTESVQDFGEINLSGDC